MADIVVLGGCIVDLISYTERFPRPGETLAGNDFFKGCGGKGANQCVMAKKLGASTAMVAKLGKDSFGQEYLQNLQDLDVICDNVSFSSSSQTSTASIVVTSEGQNSIVYVPGAILDLTPEDALAADQTIKNSKVLLCTYECPLDTLFTALTLAKKHNVKTIVNAAPATDASYEKIYPVTDIICLNEIEAEDATGIPLKTVEDCTPIIEFLHKKGCSLVILTLGSKGAVFQGKSETSYTHVPARKVNAVDSTGAGDAFMGSLAYFLAYHSDEELSIHIHKSCEIATRSVLKTGTQASFPHRKELPENFFA